ncbi:hypothetical protein C8J56DRAFT_898997 [Mycena floridula]|nr:hypothetical protein C8J56DRAFT_898997 [Mycena floridula]
MFRVHTFSALFFSSSLACSASFLANSSANATRPSTCCQSLSSKLPGKVFFPSDAAFQAQLGSYYSADESALVPSCRVGPTSAQDVSSALKILTTGNCPFAVRSGGHMVWAGAANIDAPGVTIDLLSLASISISPDKTVVRVQPGNRLGPVYNALDIANLTIVAGRSNTVGVGGFLLGGGISNLSPQHGLGNDNIVNYEIVLADGSIVEANATSSHSDLFWAMKAGSTNFGIITRYDLKTFPLNPMWGGFRTIDVAREGAVLDALKMFMMKLQKDPKGGAALNYGFNAGVESLVLDLAYLAADGSNQDLFSDLLAIPFTTNTLRTNVTQQNLSAEIDSAFPPGLRSEWTCLSFEADTQLVLDISAKAKSVFAPLTAKNISWSTNFQTLPIPFIKASAAAKSPQNIGAGNKDLYLLNLFAFWPEEKDDADVDKSIRAVQKFASDTAESRGLANSWLYLNYALPDQDVYGSYGEETVSRLKSIKKRYDANDVLGKLWHGGFKL